MAKKPVAKKAAVKKTPVKRKAPAKKVAAKKATGRISQIIGAVIDVGIHWRFASDFERA